MLDPWFRRSGPAKHVLKQALWLIREGRVVNGAARLVFTAQEEAARAHGVFQPWNPKVAVCPLAVAEPPESDGEPLPDGLGQMPYLLFLARLHPKKGADLLLEAWARLGGRTQGRALVIAGPAEDPAHAAQLHVLAAAAMRSGAGPVLFTGMVTGVAKWALLRRAEAFVLPSHQENFGIAVAEALACGVPVLTTREVALWREIVADGAGFAESDDTDGVVRLLERHLISDAAALAKRRKDARACFTNRFTEAAAWAAWRTLFQEAAG
jgi:glycosyltransferase involved in cell wall biosynthesis